ncbi:hypothetical protein Aple_029940 [Acrocarpospora pleiomorpha]|uniref:Uncharacterized protein n=1 Tax=Acrocarpospora pleiomorpha TaxID=90975 RepID=A0A5M3XPC7_9ACTN|nr:hypothetical protein [Acrocarpospora pleiomorpha]GES20098.1 hypothetical protein Aple_029940 [Acrocarpospora pleiomorpha]
MTEPINAAAEEIVLDNAIIASLTAALSRARKHNDDLADALTRARDLAYSREILVALNLSLNHAGSIADVIGAATEDASAPSIASSLDRARILARNLIGEPSFHRAAKRARVLSRGRSCSHILEPAQRLVSTLTTVRDRALDLGLDLDRARRLAIELTQADRRSEEQSAVDVAVLHQSVARSAELLVDTLTRLLPAHHRGRYTEELHTELYDLAEAKATRLMQVIYAVHQLRRVYQLRAALLDPDKPRFHRFHRAAFWILASQWRTWGLLSPPMVAAAFNVFLMQGWGSAFYTLPGIVAFYAGVEWLRTRWEVPPRRRKRDRS